ncbi:MAG: GHKL domain-containing protein, partial [Deltaproteobacteria bacterium]|nr:GHKL domain-containing protein [Deltaproteobacteria bacterium]
DLPAISCYPSELNQVFMNLLTNAAQAIQKKGDIWITTKHEEDQISIEIEDNGCGIEKEHLEHIFDPFFTTKDVGSGTGLGLSITYNIIKKHKGEIAVTSEKGKGTKFSILLPSPRRKKAAA